MKNRRYSGTDYHFWPFTLSSHGSQSYRPVGVCLDSGASEGEFGNCHIKFSAFGWTFICELPQIVPDYCERHSAKTWDAATIARLGRDWYEERFPREYGFTFSEGNLHTYFGPQTHCSSTTKSKCFFLPWRNSRFIRESLYDLQGQHFHTEYAHTRNAWPASTAVKDACPKVRFDIEDHDGQKITAATHIEEREWRFGTGLFSWLSLFRRPQICRTLAIEFGSEVGPEKGSWKGGTIGTSIDMLPGELHEDAFIRFCEQEHRSKYRRYRVRYLGKQIHEKPDTGTAAQTSPSTETPAAKSPT